MVCTKSSGFSSSSYCCTSCCLRLFLRIMKIMAAAMAMMAIPPMTPPTIAPMLLLDPDPLDSESPILLFECTAIVWLERLRENRVRIQSASGGSLTYVSARWENTPPTPGLGSTCQT